MAEEENKPKRYRRTNVDIQADIIKAAESLIEITPNENIIERSQNFQSYIDQMEQFGSKSYWVMARMGVGAKM